ncbi:pilus assembly protein [Nocardioides sp. AN3]
MTRPRFVPRLRLRAVRHGSRGSAAIEAAIGVPAFALFVGLIICGGRVATTHQALESAAADAARSASIARDQHTATTDARTAATVSITNQQIHCHNIAVRIDTSTFDKPAGESGAVHVTVSCRLDLSDLSVPGVPGSRVLTATMSSPVDTWTQQR